MQWGNWRLDPVTMELVHMPENYAVDLTEINNSAQALDWIVKVHGDNFGAADLHDFVDALDTILNLQTNYCSGGHNKEASGSALARGFVEKESPPSEVATTEGKRELVVTSLKGRKVKPRPQTGN